MRKRIGIICVFFLFSTFLLAISAEGTNLGMIMEKNEAAFAMTSNLGITPQNPSSNQDIRELRYLNGSLLLKNGIEFSFGNSLDTDDRYNYLGLSYYLKDKNYAIGIDIRSHYNTGIDYGKKPKELGASFSYKIPKRTLTPYIRYTLRQYHIGQNLELFAVGGFISISQLIFSFSYTLPINSLPELYTTKGEISINLGVFLN